MRRAARIDANHTEIVKAARELGASVTSLASVGMGCPDLLIGWRGKNLLVEVKDGQKPPSARKLTTPQVRWHGKWSGQVEIVKSVDELFNLLGV